MLLPQRGKWTSLSTKRPSPSSWASPSRPRESTRNPSFSPLREGSRTPITSSRRTEIAEALNAQFAPNPSDGYGQGSGVLVSLLPRFNILTSTILLDNWNVPRTGILSVQIDAMNPGGANYPSCHGFYQLGVDLDPHGHIAPWYVPKNCNPFYFQESQIGIVSSGFVSPPGTVLSLTIARVPSEGEMVFTLVDHDVSAPDAVWSAAIPYTGPAFVAA